MSEFELRPCRSFLCILHLGPYLSSINKLILEKRIKSEMIVKVQPAPIAFSPGTTVKIARAATKHLYVYISI